MPLATLLLKEKTVSSLSTLVEKSLERKPPFHFYELNLSPTHLEFKLLQRSSESTTDEGFESDIDSLSNVSSDGSFETKVTTETDSANGSTSCDSDVEITTEDNRSNTEFYNLVDCLCYTDVKIPDVLIFVIKNEIFVYKFDNLDILKKFYLNFTAVKAVANQKVYNNKSGNAKFNLLQRTDNNGVTHIEITCDSASKIFTEQTPSSIVSLNTPEVLVTPLRKVWSSADDLLTPKRPERRKKIKGRAPPPPKQIPSSSDILRGEYVRVNVNNSKESKDFVAKSQLKEKKIVKSNFVTLLLPKPPVKTEQVWSNSVPRLLKKQRSKSETRCFTPMAYRYIDTAPTYSPIGNRLFGLSAKLKDFGERECRWNSFVRSNEGNLKSVIKKEESKKKNEKKVTFSAYTTVQVV